MPVESVERDYRFLDYHNPENIREYIYIYMLYMDIIIYIGICVHTYIYIYIRTIDSNPQNHEHGGR